MRGSIKALAGASVIALAALPAGAQAATYIWSGGNYVPGTTSPTPLLAPDVLSITSGSNKFFVGTSFSNQSGTVDWQAGAIFFSNGSTVTNQSLWKASGGNVSLIYNGGAASTFSNSGTFRRSAAGTTSVGSVRFTNSGVIDAEVGTIAFNGGDAEFNAGSSFTGAGTVQINSDAAFNGAFSSSNLDFEGGTFTGIGASLSGTADWSAGAFAGGWTVTSGSTLTLVSGSNKLVNGANLTNNGTVAWQAGALFFSNGAAVTNTALWNATGNNSLNYNGGAAISFTNTGTFRKSGGVGNTTVGSVGFTNNGGTIDAQTGTIVFTGGDATFNAGSSFTGAGGVSIASNAVFNGAFSSANLSFDGGTVTGNGAALTGTADWTGNTLSGDWTINGGSSLVVLSGSNKLMNAAAITNNGSIDWQGGALFLANGSQLVNNGTIANAASSSMNANGGAVSTVTNGATGLIRVDAGRTLSVQNTFVNNGGTLTADGTIAYNDGTATFNTGSVFNGAGVNAINSSAGFNGAISSTNLSFNGGTVTGGAAALSGTATWTGNTFAGGWTLTNGSTLAVTTGSNKLMNGAGFTNNGVLDWRGGALFLANASALTNNGTIDYSSSSSLNANGGAVSTVTNNGLMRVAAGQTVSVSNTFVNNGGGTLTANGTFNFNNGDAVFNSGTVFDGAGTNAINSSSAFNGAISSANLRFNGGTFTGGAAALSGSAEWAAGTFSGNWSTTAGTTMTVLTGANKLMSGASFTNGGELVWQGGALFLSNGTALTNTGAIDFQTDTSVNNNGGAASSFTNNGLIEKTAGAGTTTLANGIAFDNNGTINVLSGTIALPNAFTNDGVLGGTGRFASSALTNAGAIAPGAPGAAGTLTLAGSFAQAASGALRIQLASSSSADLFNITGSAALGGTLSLSCILGCAINDGDSFVILDSAGPLSGVFANITTSGFRSGFQYQVVYDYTADLVRLDIIDAGMAAVPEPANWAMMIAGFGLAGAAARRRNKRTVLA